MDEMSQCKMNWQDIYNKIKIITINTEINHIPYRYITNGGCLKGGVYIINGGCLKGEVYIFYNLPTNGGCLEGEVYIINGRCLKGEVEYYTFNQHLISHLFVMLFPSFF